MPDITKLCAVAFQLVSHDTLSYLELRSGRYTAGVQQGHLDTAIDAHFVCRWKCNCKANPRKIAYGLYKATLTFSTPPQMPQLLTETDSFRLVPIVAT